MEIAFFVPGQPRPGGSKRVFGIKKGGAYTGRFIVTDAAGQANKDWRASVAHGAREAMKDNPPLQGPLELELLFQLPRPKGHWNARGVLKPKANLYPISRPDAGKLARSTQDAMTHIVWVDDAQVVKETHEKKYSLTAGCWIVVRKLPGCL